MNLCEAANEEVDTFDSVHHRTYIIPNFGKLPLFDTLATICFLTEVFLDRFSGENFCWIIKKSKSKQNFE